MLDVQWLSSFLSQTLLLAIRIWLLAPLKREEIRNVDKIFAFYLNLFNRHPLFVKSPVNTYQLVFKNKLAIFS